MICDAIRTEENNSLCTMIDTLSDMDNSCLWSLNESQSEGNSDVHHPLCHLHHLLLHLHLQHLVYHLTFEILMEDYEYFYTPCNNNISVLQQAFTTPTLNGESNDDCLIYQIQNASIIVQCNKITFIICSHIYGH